MNSEVLESPYKAAYLLVNQAITKCLTEFTLFNCVKKPSNQWPDIYLRGN